MFARRLVNFVLASLLSLAMLIGPSATVSGGCLPQGCCQTAQNGDGCPRCAARAAENSKCCGRSEPAVASCCQKKLPAADTQRSCCRAQKSPVPTDPEFAQLPCQCRPSPGDLPNPLQQRLVRPPAPESVAIAQVAPTISIGPAEASHRTVSQDSTASSPALWVLNCALLC